MALTILTPSPRGWAAAEPQNNRSWSFAELGIAAPIDLTGGTPTARVGPSLPEGFRQAESGWASASVRIQVSGLRTLTGIAYVEGHWNDQAFLGLKLKVVKLGESSVVEWSSTDLLNGPLRGYEAGDRAEFTISNFPVRRSVVGGANELAFSLVGQVSGVSVRVSPESRIYVTRQGPSSVKVVRGSWRRDGGLIRVSVGAENSQLAPKWVELHARIVLRDGGFVDRWIHIDSPSATGGNLIGTWAWPNESILRVEVSVRYPGGGAGPVALAERQSRWSWGRAKSAVPWTALIVLAFPVFWVSASNVLIRRTMLAVVASAVCLGAVWSSSTAVGEDNPDTLPPLDFLPFVSEKERGEVNVAVAQWLTEQFQTAVDLRRGQVWPLRENGDRKGYVVNVGLRLESAQCGGLNALEPIAAQVWVLRKCD